MNQVFKNINIEEVLFYDLELVRKNETLDVNSKEFELYQKKIRDKKTDELPTEQETVEHYKKFAALRMGYNKIVCATTGRVVEGKLYLRSFTGTEEDILKGLYSKFQTAKYISGFNCLEYDGCMARVNALKYKEVTEMLPEQFNDSGKKPWELKAIVDLMQVFKGTHFVNPSLDEVCYHLGVKSPKNDGIDGSMVSEVYYSEGVERIETYCKADVKATVDLFCVLQGKPIFETYIDANQITAPEEKELSPLEKIYNSNSFPTEVKEQIKKLAEKKKLTKKDKENLFTILLGVWQRCDFVNSDQDAKATIATKEKEIQEFIDTL